MKSKRTLKSVAVSYDLQENLGEGLNSVVYKASRSDPYRKLHQIVALKILKSRNLVEVWKSEFASLERIQHRNCVRVFGFEWVDGCPALVLEYVQGVSVRQLVMQGALTEDLAKEILAQVQSGIHSMRDYGVCHGDLSPNNVMVDVTGCVKILDFGWTSSGSSIRATPAFAAPELLGGATPNYLTDLYSLGALEKMLLATESNRLHENPLNREAYPVSPCSRRQAALSRHVRRLMEIQNRLKDVATKSMLMPRRKIPMPKAAVVIMMLLCAPNSQCLSPIHHAELKIRTHSWTKIRLDKAEIGYSPQNLLLSSDQTHTVEWSSPAGQGEMKVRMRNGEIRLLGDRDFVP